jgi:outer membrane protein TolC
VTRKLVFVLAWLLGVQIGFGEDAKNVVTLAAPLSSVLRPTYDPFAPYRGITVPPPSLQNSGRLDELIRDGKLYLSLHDAIELALENNLDVAIMRYNLAIADTDVMRTSAGGLVRGVNTGVVQGTPGGQSSSGTEAFGTGAGAGGTSTGAGGAGAGTSGLVQSTLGAGTAVEGYDPMIGGKLYVDHTSQTLTNLQLYGVPVLRDNTGLGNFSFSQAFATGTSLAFQFDNNRQTFNSPYVALTPQFNSSMQMVVQQQLLAGFGLGPNLRYLRIAKNNRRISDIAFRAQVIATVAQVSNIYWDLVDAFDDEKVKTSSLEFAQRSLETTRKEVQLESTPAMEVMKAEAEVATREEALTTARANLQLQELLIKNAITRRLDDPALEEMPVLPEDRMRADLSEAGQPVENLIAQALESRPELQESGIDLQNRELSRKTARNALLPTLSLYGLYAGTGYGGKENPLYAAFAAQEGTPIPISVSPGLGGALDNAFNNSSPEYQVGFQLSIPLRNRIAKADQYRTELEYRQSQLNFEEQKKRIRIEVRNAQYALQQGLSRVAAARKARDLRQKTLEIMQQEQKLGAGSNQQTLDAEYDLALAESALVSAESSCEKARVELRRATGTLLEDYGISLAGAKAGVGQGANP